MRIGFFLIQIRVCYLTVGQGYIFRGMITHATMPYAVAGDDYLFHVNLEVFDRVRISVCPITLQCRSRKLFTGPARAQNRIS